MELVITMAMLSLLTLLLFGAFEMGTRIFRDTTVRQSSENQLRAIKLLLERDINQSNFWYCSDYSTGRDVGSKKRNGLALATLDNWDDPTNFDITETNVPPAPPIPPTYRPMWNRYIVWYADMRSPVGNLYRQLVQPATVPAGGFTAPYDPLVLAANINDDPSLNTDVIYSRTLSENVLEFKTEMSFRDGAISTTINLRADGIQRPGTLDKTQDNLQVRFIFQPKNSWPKI